MFDECVVSHHGQVLNQKIIEAAVIESEGEKCISTPSIALPKNEKLFRHPVVKIPKD